MFIAGLILTAIAGAMQYKQAQEQARAQEQIAREQKKQQELNKRISDVKAARERAKLVREQRIKRAQMVAQGEALGGAGGSAMAGGTGSLTTRTAGELGFSQVTQDTGTRIFASNQRISGLNVDISNAQAQSALWGAVGGIGSGMFNAGGGWQTVGKKMGS